MFLKSYIKNWLIKRNFLWKVWRRYKGFVKSQGDSTPYLGSKGEAIEGLNFFKGSEGRELSASEYEAVCNNTKIVTQRAIMGANIIDIKAQELYNNNGNKIDKYFVKWDTSSKKCIAKYIIRALQGTTETVTVSGEAKGFLKTDFDTRVYYIKNF